MPEESQTPFRRQNKSAEFTAASMTRHKMLLFSFVPLTVSSIAHTAKRCVKNIQHAQRAAVEIISCHRVCTVRFNYPNRVSSRRHKPITNSV